MAWQEPPWYGTVCQVVWEDGGGNPASYPIASIQVFIPLAILPSCLVPSFPETGYGAGMNIHVFLFELWASNNRAFC